MAQQTGPDCQLTGRHTRTCVIENSLSDGVPAAFCDGCQPAAGTALPWTAEQRPRLLLPPGLGTPPRRTDGSGRCGRAASSGGVRVRGVQVCRRRPGAGDARGTSPLQDGVAPGTERASLGISPVCFLFKFPCPIIANT